MSFKPFHFWLLVLAGLTLPGATTAQARDRLRIPLPPPPGEVIQDVREFIHGIGRGIRRAGGRIVASAEAREREDLPPLRSRRHYNEDDEWDGEFYPDEHDAPTHRRHYRHEGVWTEEEELRWLEHQRREENRRRNMESRRQDPRERPDAQDLEENPELELTPPPSPQTPPSSSSPSEPPPVQRRATPEGFRAPDPSPAPSPAPEVKRTAPPSPSAPPSKSTPPSQVPFASPVPGKKGLVYPPGAEKKAENMVDVSDFQPGQLVRNPKTGELFRVP